MTPASKRVRGLVYYQAKSPSIARIGHRDWRMVYDRVQDQNIQVYSQIWQQVQQTMLDKVQ